MMYDKILILGILLAISGNTFGSTLCITTPTMFDDPTQTTLSQSQNQTVDGQHFNFDFNTGDHKVGSTSNFTLTLQGDFDHTETEFASINIGGGDSIDFNRITPMGAYDIQMKGFNNTNAYRYKIDFALDALQTSLFMENSTVFIDFSDGVDAQCGWWNYSNCVESDSLFTGCSSGSDCMAFGDSPYVQVDYSYVSAVPIPAAVWMFGSALFGLIVIARRKK